MLFALIPSALALAPGEPLDEALAVHVTNQGLGRIGDAIAGLVPESITVTGFSGELYCDEGGDSSPLTYGMGDLSLYITPQEIGIEASEGRLDLTLTLTLDTNTTELTAAGDCSILQGLDEVCVVELPTAAMTVGLGMAMELVDGQIVVDAEPIDLWVSPITNPLDSCTLSKAIGTLLNQDPDFISNLIVSLVEPELAGLDTELEATLNDALGQLALETSVDLLGTPLDLEVYPSSLTLDDNGLFLGLGVEVGAVPISSCVPAGVESPTADADWPELDTRAFDSTLEYDAGILLNKDLVDHVLWTVWSSGLLCLEISDLSELSESVAITLDTDLLGTLLGTGEEFDALFGEEPRAAAIATSSTAAPVVVFDDDVPLAIDMGDFGIDLVAELDGRNVRLAQIGLDETIGLDPGISGSQIAPELYLDLYDLPLTETYSELLEPGFSKILISTLPDLIAQFAGEDLLEGLLPIINIPTWNGIGLDAVFWIPDSDGQWLGGFALIDTASVQPIEIGGCDASGFGCGGFEDTGGSSTDLDFEALLGCDSASMGCGGGDTGYDTGYDTGLGGSSDCGGCESSGGCEDSSCATTGRRRVFWPGWRLMLLGLVAGGVLIRRR